MRFVSSWACADHRVLMSIDESVLTTFEHHVQAGVSDSEAGGILLGTVHGDNLVITEATTPTVMDKRLRFLFERMPFGHRAIARLRWKRSGGTVRYLGEWHTHPQDVPSPSGIDRVEWNKLTAKRLDGRPLLAVIVGRKDLYVELVPEVGRGVVLHQVT